MLPSETLGMEFQSGTSDLSIRASAMPMASKCPASVRRPSLPVAETCEPADLGSATHEALRPLAEGGSIPWDSLPEIALRWNVDADDLRSLCAMAGKLWPTVQDSFRGAMTEVEYRREIAPGVELTGHLDLLAVNGTVARAGDWKSGRKDADYSEQMRAYGTLVLLDEPQLTEVTVTILWIRDGDIENYTMTRDDAVRWIRQVRDRVVRWDGTYRPGAHCQYCPRSHECHARNALVRRDVAILLDVDIAKALSEMTPGQVIDLYKKAAIVEKTAGYVRAAVRAHVEENGALVADGRRLDLVEEQRRALDPIAAWPVLEAEGFRDEEFAEVIDMSVSRTEKLVATRAGRGKGAAAVRAISAKLEAAGAVKVGTVKKLTERRR